MRGLVQTLLLSQLLVDLGRVEGRVSRFYLLNLMSLTMLKKISGIKRAKVYFTLRRVNFNKIISHTAKHDTDLELG